MKYRIGFEERTENNWGEKIEVKELGVPIEVRKYVGNFGYNVILEVCANSVRIYSSYVKLAGVFHL